MSKKENKVQLEAMKYLKNKGVLCWRNNTMGVYDPKLNIYRSNPYNMKGVGDIVGMTPDGRFLSIEVKTKTGKPSADQLLFIKRCTLNGGLCFVARSIEDIQSYGL